MWVAARAQVCGLHLWTAMCAICSVHAFGVDVLILAAGSSWGHENAAALQLWGCDRRKSPEPRNLPNSALLEISVCLQARETREPPSLERFRLEK